ncbi:MAG: 4Fe-4S dicluster domain-containing protein [Treponema sp.]|jgi:anaerobic dimethyl sulfoxide reductase subunit B (iron-sulfur subunit)|nr:4Fe-4S dicluster domain-containing protein [Treponema sp.]
MGRLGFYFDARFCIACNACSIACKDKNALWDGQFFRTIITFEHGVVGFYSASCNHCAKGACVSACPQNAIQVKEDGTVVIDPEDCIGCGACATACPYQVIGINQTRGKAAKCDACADLREKGRKPACVDACLTQCLDFGDLDELAKQYGPGLVRQNAVLPPPSRTEPSLLIHPRNI